jgi:hypothetical protein
LASHRSLLLKPDGPLAAAAVEEDSVVVVSTVVDLEVDTSVVADVEVQGSAGATSAVGFDTFPAEARASQAVLACRE